VTVLDVMDSFAVRTCGRFAHMIRLRGAETVIVGIQPEWPLRWSNGLTLGDITTALDLEEGLACLNQKTAAGARMSSNPRARPAPGGERGGP